MKNTICTCCEGELRNRTLYEDGRVVETCSECKSCGFTVGWSYGQDYVEYPEGYYEDGNKIEVDNLKVENGKLKEVARTADELIEFWYAHGAPKTDGIARMYRELLNRYDQARRELNK